uniref:Uncharacterized protein n=1 Tax=Plectus sambesii TaxID=2011161 RepID=A0A914V4J5_9BILA
MLAHINWWGTVPLKSMAATSILQVAERAGLLALSPSDLVFESNSLGITYYNYVLSSSTTSTSCILYLAKLDAQTNVESFDSAVFPKDLLAKNAIPDDDLSLVTLGLLLWKRTLSGQRVLCLVQSADAESIVGLEAVNKASKKLQCAHHVLTTGKLRGVDSEQRKQSSMRLRLMMCQTRNDIANLPARTLHETRCLVAPTKRHPLLCLCVPVS